MKKWIRFLIISLSFFFACAASAADTYTIDPNHSYVLWHISHFDFSHPSGKWMVAEGTLNLDKNKPQNSKVNVLIHVNDTSTRVKTGANKTTIMVSNPGDVPIPPPRSFF